MGVLLCMYRTAGGRGDNYRYGSPMRGVQSRDLTIAVETLSIGPTATLRPRP